MSEPISIGCFLSDVSTGGGHYLTKDFAKNILKLNNTDYKITLVTTTDTFNEYLKKNNLNYIELQFNFIEKFLLRFWKIKLTRFFFNFWGINSPVENFAKKKKFDLLIFNSPSVYVLLCRKINFVASIWNTEIDDLKNFTEFNKKNFNYQKNIINKIVKDSFKLLVFTNKNKEDLVERFNCLQDKILIQNLKPHFPNIYENTKDKNFFKNEYKKLKLDKGKKWIFYPAQFWSHKNHEYIINSIQEINKLEMSNINFVFCGRNKGYLTEIKNKIDEKNLGDRFKIFDYLDENKVIGLYLYSYALVIPTHVGRTTMPLMEGLFFNKKIFYSDNILDKKFYNYVTGINLKDPKNFAEKLFDYVHDKSLNKNDFRKIYNEECNDELFLLRYKQILNQFKYKKYTF
jgi:hypothetical protein